MASESDILTAIKEITKSVEGIRIDQAVAAHESRAARKELETIRRIITGDSEPERGLSFRLHKLEGHVEALRDESRAVKKWAWSAIGSAVIGVTSAVWHKLSN